MINKQFISAFLSTVMAVSILCTPLTSIHAYAVEETSDIVAEDSEVIEPGEEVEDFRDDGEVEDNLETTVSEDTEDTEIQENAAVDGTESDSALEEEIEAEEQAEGEENQIDQVDQIDVEKEDSEESEILPEEENTDNTEPVDDSDDITADEIENAETENEVNEIVSEDFNVSVDSIDDNALINISKCTFGELSSKTYSGKAMTPSITIKDGDRKLTVNTDYIAEYKNNTNAGIAKIIITGKGTYTGTVEKTFKITPKKVTPTVTISNKTLIYNGLNRTPSVSVKYGSTVLKRNQDYTVRYASKCSNVGTYNAAVTLKGNYSGSNKAQYTILPKGTSIYNVVGSKDHFDVKWSKQTTQVTGYQIQYSHKRRFDSGNKTVTINQNSVNTKTIKKPTAGEEYYVRVRTYMVAGGKRYYSSWSSEVSTFVKEILTYEKKSLTLHSSEQYEIEFSTSKRVYSMIPITIKVVGSITRGGFRIILKDEKGKQWQNDYIDLKNSNSGDTYDEWFYNDGGLLPPGEYTYIIKNASYADIKISFSPTAGYSKKAASASVRSSVSSASGNWVKIGKLYDGLPVATINYPKNGIIDGYLFEKDGSVYVWGEKKGTATVTVKVSDGKIYKTKVTLSSGEPDFAAVVDGYYTRDNYFTVTIKNRRRSDLIIIRDGAKVENYDYKSNDRWVKADSNITVKYGETKTVRFYLKGSPTWPDYKDYDLHAKFIFEGKTYVWHVWRNDSSYQKGNGWFTTYWGSNDL